MFADQLVEKLPAVVRAVSDSRKESTRRKVSVARRGNVPCPDSGWWQQGDAKDLLCVRVQVEEMTEELHAVQDELVSAQNQVESLQRRASALEASEVALKSQVSRLESEVRSRGRNSYDVAFDATVP